MYSELENSGIRVEVGDCNVTERRGWRPALNLLSNWQNCIYAYKHTTNMTRTDARRWVCAAMVPYR